MMYSTRIRHSTIQRNQIHSVMTTIVQLKTWKFVDNVLPSLPFYKLLKLIRLVILGQAFKVLTNTWGRRLAANMEELMDTSPRSSSCQAKASPDRDYCTSRKSSPHPSNSKWAMKKWWSQVHQFCLKETRINILVTCSQDSNSSL